MTNLQYVKIENGLYLQPEPLRAMFDDAVNFEGLRTVDFGAIVKPMAGDVTTMEAMGRACPNLERLMLTGTVNLLSMDDHMIVGIVQSCPRLTALAIEADQVGAGLDYGYEIVRFPDVLL